MGLAILWQRVGSNDSPCDPIPLIWEKATCKCMSQPQPVQFYPPPHSHGNYIGAIIAAGVIALVVGVAFGYGLGSLPRPVSTSPQPQQSYTWTTGTVDWRGLDQSSSFVKLYVAFTNPETGGISSAIYRDNTYQTWLISGKTYSVDIWYWTSSQGYAKCVVTPNTMTPSGASYSQNVSC
jgi:hypothetical protein